MRMVSLSLQRYCSSSYFIWNREMKGKRREFTVGSVQSALPGLQQPYSFSVCISLSAWKKNLCTNPELLGGAINGDIIPWLDISHTSKASLKHGVTAYMHSHFLLLAQEQFYD